MLGELKPKGPKGSTPDAPAAAAHWAISSVETESVDDTRKRCLAKRSRVQGSGLRGQGSGVSGSGF